MSRFNRFIMTAIAVACAGLAGQTAKCRAAGMQLWVDPGTGAVSILNQSYTTAVSLDGYQITSATGQLVPDPTNTPNVGWDSLTAAGVAGWTDASPTANGLSELNLNTSSLVAPGGVVNLGRAFTVGGTKNLQWGYSSPGNVQTLPAGILYNDVLQLQVIRLVTPANVVESTKAVILNTTTASISLDGYLIQSADNSLSTAGFKGYSGLGVAGWDSVAPSSSALTELNLNGSATIAVGSGQVLGSPYASGGAQDLTFQYHVAGGNPVNGNLIYKTQLSADVNFDRIVNIFDINLISSNWATAGPTGDGNYDGVVNIFDINFVSSHWNNALPGGGAASVAAVPEPSSLALLGFGLLSACGVFRRQRSTMRMKSHS